MWVSGIEFVAKRTRSTKGVHLVWSEKHHGQLRKNDRESSQKWADSSNNAESESDGAGPNSVGACPWLGQWGQTRGYKKGDGPEKTYIIESLIHFINIYGASSLCSTLFQTQGMYESTKYMAGYMRKHVKHFEK